MTTSRFCRAKALAAATCPAVSSVSSLSTAKVKERSFFSVGVIFYYGYQSGNQIPTLHRNVIKLRVSSKLWAIIAF